MKNRALIRWIIGFLLVAFLILIRHYETSLFYDPFLLHFKRNFQELAMPSINPMLLYGSYSVRFLINSGISLGILWCLFQREAYLKSIAILFLVFLVLLLFSLWYSLNFETQSFQLLIYSRRFLNYPVLLLVFIGALYYQKTTSR